jgi:hypothetical protein
MKDILKFVLIFIVSYGSFIYLFSLPSVQLFINRSFRTVVEFSVKQALPKAYIDTQEDQNTDAPFNPNIFYIIYGNPEVIKAEKNFAEKQQLKEYTISTYSIQFYIFELFTVPVVFLISLFVATPLQWKILLRSILISMLILFALIIGKCILLTLFMIANLKIGVYNLNETTLYIVYRVAMMLRLGLSIIVVFCLWLMFGFKNSVFAIQLSNFLKSFQK